MNSVLRRSNLGGARQLVCNHEQTGAVAPSENGRLPPVLAHQLACVYEFFGDADAPGVNGRFRATDLTITRDGKPILAESLLFPNSRLALISKAS